MPVFQQGDAHPILYAFDDERFESRLSQPMNLARRSTPSIRTAPHALRLRVAALSSCLLSLGLTPLMTSVVRAQTNAATEQPVTTTPAASTAAASTSATPTEDEIKQREQELEAARAQQKSAAELQEKLKADIAAIGEDRSKLNQQLIDIAAKVRGIETRISDAEARLRELDTREQTIRGSLDSRRSEVVEVLAALQRVGRRAPPALLVSPEDALESLRTAILLGAVVPEMRARSQKLVADLGELVTLRKTISAERDQLATDRDGTIARETTDLVDRVEAQLPEGAGRYRVTYAGGPVGLSIGPAIFHDLEQDGHVVYIDNGEFNRAYADHRAFDGQRVDGTILISSEATDAYPEGTRLLARHAFHVNPNDRELQTIRVFLQEGAS